MNSQKEQFLLFRIRAFRDQVAFANLIAHHQPPLRRFLTVKLPTVQDVEDALSETYIRAWNYLTVSEVENALALFLTIARGAVADFYRSRGDIPSVPLEGVEDDPRSGDQGEAENAMVIQADAARVRERMGALPEEQQIALMLRYFEGKSMREIGQKLNKSENATRVLVHRALKALKKELCP